MGHYDCKKCGEYMCLGECAKNQSKGSSLDCDDSEGDEPVSSEELPEFEAKCDRCDTYWWIQDIPPAKPSVKALIGLTGYRCSDCAGDDPQLRMFKARRSFRKDEEDE